MAIDRPQKPAPVAVQVNERAASAAKPVGAILQQILHRTLVDGYYGNVTLTIAVEDGQMMRVDANELRRYKF